MCSIDGPPLSVKSRFLSQEIKSQQFKEISTESDIVYECWPSCFGTWLPFPENDKKAFPHTVNVEEGQCSCHMWRLVGSCPHLIGIFAALNPTDPDIDNPFSQCLDVLDEISIERESEVNETALQCLRQKWAEVDPIHARVENLTQGNQTERKTLINDVNTELAWAKRSLGPIEFSSYMAFIKRQCVEWRNEHETSRLESGNDSPSTYHSGAHDPHSRTFRTQVRVPSAGNTESPGSGTNEDSPHAMRVLRPIPVDPGTQTYQVHSRFREERQE